MLDMLGQPQQLLSFSDSDRESRDMMTPVTLVTAVTARCGSNHDGRPFCPDPAAVRGAPWGPAVPGAMSLAAKLHGEARSAEPRTLKCDM
jgi:hypothetical protein